MRVTIIGGGLAGSEAAWQLATRGVEVRLIEMKPKRYSPAHSASDLGELVCSNSLRSASRESAAGLLKEELRILESLIMEAADATSVPAGKALAVDRTLFSRFITQRIMEHPLIRVEREVMGSVPTAVEGPVIVATGPLTSDELAADIARLLGSEGMYFYDAIAPIVLSESLNMTILFRASRYDNEEGDYLNAPMDEAEYRSFVAAILNSEKVEPHPFEKIQHFEGCLPVEELAERGPDTLAFGPMKPVGLIDPSTGRRPFAVVQFRAENREGTSYNMVGFQTKMTYPEQERVFRSIPGMERAVFARMGSIHRNTYVDAPRYLDQFSRSLAYPHVFFAGQITGVEGYIESTASGLAVGLMAGILSKGQTPDVPPPTTAIGGLLRHTQMPHSRRYEPMNVNFGLLDGPPAGTPKRRKREFIASRALEAVREWKDRINKFLPVFAF